MKKLILIFLILIFITGCVQKETEKSAKKETVVIIKQQSCPESCDDNKACTYDYCSEKTDYECKHSVRIPCCGNDMCESEEDYKTCPEDCEKPSNLNEELAEILDKNKEVDNYEYFYSDGTIYIDFWIKENRIKEELFTKTTRKFFDTKDNIIILDTENKTAYSYCTKICGSGNKLEANKTDYYKFKMETPLEFAKKIPLYAETIGEESLENRKILVIGYKANDGSNIKVWLIKYYGIPTRIETTKDGEKTKIEYTNFAFKSVTDDDFADPYELKYVD